MTQTFCEICFKNEAFWIIPNDVDGLACNNYTVILKSFVNHEVLKRFWELRSKALAATYK
jgi:hypothetical protein